jgi:hypothetical protein
MITIELVRVGDRLIGRDVSSRFNLKTFGVDSLPYERSQAAVKRLRRLVAGFGLSVVVVRRGAVQWSATESEAKALGPIVLPAYVRAAA